MNLFLLPFLLLAASAVFYLVFIFSLVIKNWREQHHLQKQGCFAKAKIIEVDIKNEPGRCLPFVQLVIKVEAEGGFITSIDSLVSPEELTYLHIGASIQVVYSSLNRYKIKLVKKSTALEKATPSKIKLLPARKLSVA